MTTPTKPTAFPSFGAAPQKYDAIWMTAFLSQLARRIGLLAGPNSIQPQILLQAPNGTVYEVTVDNSGNITTTVATRGVVQPPM
jgi:hypothetical protein